MDRFTLARKIDHTFLDQAATPGQVAMFCGEATLLDVAAVCVSPSRLPLAHGALPPHIATCTVIGFPSGGHRTAVKVAEAAQAVVDGATELDLVIDLGLASAGLWDRIEAEIAAVRAVVPAPRLLKVIIESATLSDDRIVAACQAAEAAGADFVKTSTGFHHDGGASLAAVELMAKTVDGRLGVKASGGIRDTATALAMLDAGASRLGCSASRVILEGL